MGELEVLEPEARDAIKSHVAASSAPAAIGNGEWAWPNAPASSAAAKTWASLRSGAAVLAEVCSTLRAAPNAPNGTVTQASVDDALARLDIALGYTRVGDKLDVHFRAARASVAAVGQEQARWTAGANQMDAKALAAALAQVRKAAEDLTAALTPVLALGAFAVVTGAADSAVQSYRRGLSEALANATRDLATEKASLEALRRQVEQLRTTARETLDTAQRAAGRSAVNEFRDQFGKSAAEHGHQAGLWFGLAAFCGVVGVAFAAWFVGFSHAPEPVAWQALVFRMAPRVVLISVPLAAAIWSARMSTMHRRAKIADEHRLNALGTYAQLSAAAPGEAGKLAVMNAVTACVFGTPTSIDHGPEPTVPLPNTSGTRR